MEHYIDLFLRNEYNRLVSLFFISHFVTYWILSCIFFIWDLIIDSETFLYKYSKRDNKIYPIDWKLYNNCFIYVLKTQLFLLLPFMYCSAWIYNFGKEESILDYVLKLGQALIYEEIMFYYAHRLLHTQKMWKYHSKHHQLITSVAVATIYSSPVENLLCNFIPVTLVPYFTNMSMELSLFWTIIATASAVFSHCGFVFLKYFTKSHSIHHLTKSSNYGVLGILDYIHGTYSD
jgi:sterol desaturase/sphingolipid hydroxylase (fatty acid hydroxylase superfamily)